MLCRQHVLSLIIHVQLVSNYCGGLGVVPPSINAISEGLCRTSRSPFCPTLHATSEGGDGKKEKQQKSTGVYVRPSGAIERGSGFFVPGLEGPRVRLVIGILLLVLTAVNHFLGIQDGTMGLDSSGDVVTTGIAAVQQPSFEEALAVVYSLLILFQASIENAKEARQAEAAVSGGGSGSWRPSRTKPSTNSGSDVVLDQHWADIPAATVVDDSFRSNVQWAAVSYMAMTPATQMMLLTSDVDSSSSALSGPTVLYRLGLAESKDGSTTASQESNDHELVQEGIRAALRELRKSKGGRIALPLTHPTVKALIKRRASSAAPIIAPEKDGDIPRTVILQRITDNSCWLVASNQLLASFTQGDLKWLGQLGKYVAESKYP